MDCQISELSAELQSLTQSCRQLDAGGVHHWSLHVYQGHCCFAQSASLLEGLFLCLLRVFERGCCVHFCVISTNRAEGAQQRTDNRGNGVRDPGAERRVFRVQSPSAEDKVGHESHHTGREREGGSAFRQQTVVKIYLVKLLLMLLLLMMFFQFVVHYNSILLIIFNFSGLQRAGCLREGVEKEEEIGKSCNNGLKDQSEKQKEPTFSGYIFSNVVIWHFLYFIRGWISFSFWTVTRKVNTSHWSLVKIVNATSNQKYLANVWKWKK